MMKFTLHCGLPELPFGTHKSVIVEHLGFPQSEMFVADTPTYPKSRQMLDYGHFDLLVTPEFGLTAITVDAEAVEISLNSNVINKLSPQQFADYLKSLNGSDVTMTTLDGFGDQDVQSVDMGIIASYDNECLTTLEIHNPLWRVVAQQAT